MSANEDDIKETCDRVDKMEKLITLLKDKTDDLENRSRRTNVRILNVPEQSEGRDTVGFLERFIPQPLGRDNFTSPVSLERAHRVGKISDRPRPISSPEAKERLYRRTRRYPFIQITAQICSAGETGSWA